MSAKYVGSSLLGQSKLKITRQKEEGINPRFVGQ